MFDSEQNEQHKRVLCIEYHRLPNETIKQLGEEKTLKRKAFSLNTQDSTNTKMTKLLMISLTQHLPKVAIKKRASHSSSIQEADIDFRKQVDKQDQAEVTMKLEKAENIKLQYDHSKNRTLKNYNNRSRDKARKRKTNQEIVLNIQTSQIEITVVVHRKIKDK